MIRRLPRPYTVLLELGPANDDDFIPSIRQEDTRRGRTF